MNADLHERARLLIALSGPEEVSAADQSWLAAHLESCDACRDFAESSSKAIRAMRAIPISAGAHLVSTTQMRVRERAQELQRRQERLWVISVCCITVTLSAAIASVALWRGFAWIGQQARLSPPVWEMTFVVCSLLPAVLASILLLARGTHLADHNGSWLE